MSGYTRQSTADIIPTAVVRAAPINTEFNALRDAFDFDTTGSTGHKHDGTADEGSYVPLIADIDGLNKVVIDTVNNRVQFFVEVSSAATEQLRIQDGVIVPVTDNDIDLGTSGVEFKDLYLDGTAKIDTLTVDENATIAGTLDVTGASTFTGNVTATNDLTVNGNTTLGNAATDTVTITADVASNIIPSADSTYTLGDGSNYWSHGYMDAVTTTGNATVGGALSVAGNTTLTGNLTVNGNTIIGDSNTDTVTITADVASAIIPSADSTYGLGDSSNYWSSAYIDAITTTGNVTVGGNLGVTGTTTFTGTVTANGNTVLGSDASDTVTITADVASNIIPSADSTYTLGDTSNYWSHGYIDAITTTGNITVGGTLTVTSTIDMTSDKIINLGTPTNSTDAATKGYVDTAVSNLVDSAPGTLDTLNELAAALGDDPNFATTVTNSIATKLSLSGGTMTGDIAMGSNKVTGLGTPTSGNDATNKTYVDGILGSATAAAASAAAAAASATSAANSYDSFDDRYLGAKGVEPTLDNDGDPLLTGALYFNTVSNKMRVYDGAAWNDAGSAVNGTAERFVYTATASQTTFSANYDIGFVDVYLNGVKLVAGTDFTATSGTSIVLATGATSGDIVDIIGYGAFIVANTYTQAAADARFLQIANNLSDLNDAPTALQNLGLTATAAEINILDGATLSTAELNILDGVTASAAELNYNDITTLGTSEASKVVTADANGDVSLSEELKAKSYNETYVALSGTTPAVDCEAGNVFALSTSGNTTFTFSNPPASGTAYGFTIKLTAGGTHTITWPASVDWAGGAAPDAPASGETDVLVFFTHDGGTNWYGARSIDAAA